MIKQQTLQSLIEEKIPLRQHGKWNVIKCQLCNDYKERGGFLFADGSVIYNCWNCSTTSRFEEFSGRISKKMRTILHAYGIEDSEISAVINTAFFVKEESTKLTLSSLTKVNTQTPPVKLPPNSFRLGETIEHLDVQQKIVSYLDKRCVDVGRQTMFFSTDERFKNRVIIPFYRNGALIYWQARSIDPFEKKRYDNCIAGRDAVMFNMDELNSFSPVPLFVTEGVFDAAMFNGIAILGSKFTDAKLELLNNTRRRLVFVIDKDKNGRSLAESALKVGWEITFVPDGAEDLNRSVVRFGRAWTAQQLINNIPKNADAAQLAIEINCK